MHHATGLREGRSLHSCRRSVNNGPLSWPLAHLARQKDASAFAILPDWGGADSSINSHCYSICDTCYRFRTSKSWLGLGKYVCLFCCLTLLLLFFFLAVTLSGSLNDRILLVGNFKVSYYVKYDIQQGQWKWLQHVGIFKDYKSCYYY